VENARGEGQANIGELVSARESSPDDGGSEERKVVTRRYRAKGAARSRTQQVLLRPTGELCQRFTASGVSRRCPAEGNRCDIAELRQERICQRVYLRAIFDRIGIEKCRDQMTEITVPKDYTFASSGGGGYGRSAGLSRSEGEKFAKGRALEINRER